MAGNDSNEPNNLKSKRDRRKRVARIKTAILSTIAIWMAISIIVITLLCIKVVSLQKQIDILTGDYDYSENVDAAVNGADSGLKLVNQTDEDIDNLAGTEDVLKVYLTFDDGPSENTNEILDILDDYGVKATFFVVGKPEEEYKGIYQRIVNEGHTIGMHSYSHKYSEIYSSLDAFKNDFEQIQNLIYDTTGVESVYYRFPGGSSNKVSNIDMSQYIQYVNDQGVKYFDWNVSNGDATSLAYTPDDLVENVMNDVVKYKTSVVLMHDTEAKDATVQALPKLIEELQKAGALILPIDGETTVIQHVTISQ
ncbi:MAG: polysaccharide deacetylase [Lachnospiraceae bacterium]|nr:polysaccharide deacetylase [Lachnospiraceae bacterium]